MKKFFEEFKKFITRGNVLDMSVGVIVGGAFTAIVNGLTNFILKPLVNWIIALCIGADGLSGAITVLSGVYLESGELDLAASIYIDWGSFISAILNFFIIAIVLFTIVKAINAVKDIDLDGAITKEDRKAMRKLGIKLTDKAAVEAYMAEKAAKEAEAKAEEARIAEEKAKAERLANPTTEDLLKEIIVLLKKEQ